MSENKITRYRASVSFNEIKSVEVVKETKVFITLKAQHGRVYREAKVAESYGTFRTWEEAQTFLLEYHDKKLVKYQNWLNTAQKAFNEVQEKVKPESAKERQCDIDVEWSINSGNSDAKCFSDKSLRNTIACDDCPYKNLMK